jgi:formylglycine-generating enzyme required for sulfatase activity
MTLIPVSPGQAYCMDRTEVTQAQYAAFLQAKGKDLSGQTDPYCAKNNITYGFIYATDATPGCPEGVFTPEQTPDTPVACVDWCDAVAYCQWAGKRLCGRIGGGSVDVKEGASSVQSEWYYACSQGGKTAYPYGDTYQKGKCRDDDPTATSAKPATDSACHGTNPPFDEIVDLSGNLFEWEDSCDDIHCRIRGGNFVESPKGASCSAGLLSGKIADYSSGVGFRCCAD